MKYSCYILYDESNHDVLEQLRQYLDSGFAITFIPLAMPLKEIKQAIMSSKTIHLLIIISTHFTNQLDSLVKMTKAKKHFACAYLGNTPVQDPFIDFADDYQNFLTNAEANAKLLIFLAKTSAHKQREIAVYQAKIDLLSQLTQLTRAENSVDTCIDKLTQNLAALCQAEHVLVFNNYKDYEVVIGDKNIKIETPIPVSKAMEQKKVKVCFEENSDELQKITDKKTRIAGSLTFPIICNKEIIRTIHCYIPEDVLEIITLETISLIEQACRQLQIILERKKAMLDLETQHQTLKQTLHELETTKEQLYQSEKLAAIGQLSAGIAHEINNPLAFVNSNFKALKSYIVTLQEAINMHGKLIQQLRAPQNPTIDLTNFDKTYKKSQIDFIVNDLDSLVADSTEGLSRIHDIINNLLTFTRKDNTGTDFFNVNQGIESTLKILNNQTKYGITINKKLEEIPCINCNAGLLNQVFLNVLQNAIHAVDGKGEITVKTSANDHNVFVSIRDNGCGIPDEIKRDIFNPFFTTKDVGKGTGLGLSISHSIIEKHKGKININSTTGEFTEFTIELPINC